MIVYGKQVFFYILQRHKNLIKELYLAKDCDKLTFNKIAKEGFKINKLDPKKAQALAKNGNHQGFLMDLKDYNFADFSSLKKENFLALLFNVSDVGNIGAIARSAYAFGLDGLILSNQIPMSGVIRSSCGAALDLKIAFSKDILSLLNELKMEGFSIYASAKDGKDVKKLSFADKKILIMGSEGFGLPKKILKKSDEILSIKMKNDFDSLNVNAAFSILCDRIVNG